MTITTVHYQRLANLGDYQNERVGAWAQVEEGETAEEALEKLKGWVEGRIHDRELESALQNSVQSLEYRKQSLERDVAALRSRWEGAKAWLEKLGLAVPSRYDDDPSMPF